MLDVAAVAERLIKVEVRFDRPLRDAIVLLTALHDLGKIGKRLTCRRIESVSTYSCGISCGFEGVPTFVWREEITALRDGLDELLERSCTDAAEMGLQLEEGHLDGVEIGTVGGQEREPAALRFEHLCGDIALVGCEGVEDDAGPRFHLGDQDLFDAFFDAFSMHVSKASRSMVHRDHPRGYDPIAGQTRDHCLVPPSPERGISLETLPAQASPVGVGAGLIQKDQPVRLRTHELLATLPVMSCLSHLGLVAFFGDQAFHM